jgi:Ni/Co efflux regulator RcnB
MLKLIAVACVALAFASEAAAQSVIDKAKAQEQKQQQQKAQEKQAAAKNAQETPHMKKVRADCNAKADGKKLKWQARKRYMDDCVKT